jgi:phosphoglycolate phosphatase-like HAD superfamily hydrolase
LKALRAHHPARGLKPAAERRLHRRLSSPISRRSRSHAESQTPPPLLPFAGRVHAADALPLALRAFIFDVEGTLIDNVLATLQCWSETLAEIGYTKSGADLHPYSGMDGKRMLRRLLNRHDPKLLDHIVQLQGERYRAHYLAHVRAFPGLRRLFAMIKNAGGKIALATSCDKDELAHYRSVMNADDLIDHACSGDDVRRDKPSPDVVNLAARKLHLPPQEIAMVGDTPYDAEAARAAGLFSIGLQSGHYSRSDLRDGGCDAVFFDLQALAQRLEERAVEPPDDLKSHIVAAADSR